MGSRTSRSADTALRDSVTAYTHVLFDHDGVLVDTEPLYFAATRKHLARLGVELEREQFLALQVRGGNAWQLVAPAQQAQVDGERDARDETYQALLRSQPIEIEGVLETLETLAGWVKMCIVTTARRDDFELIHRERSIVPYMDFVLCREDYANSKPDPEPYLMALARFGVPAENALVVEDSARGLAAALAAGLDCAVVHSEFTAGQDFTGARYQLASLAELEEVLT